MEKTRGESEGLTRGMTRREFIKGTAVGAVGVGITAYSLGLVGCAPEVVSELPEKWDEETDVVVVGSGFAGLAAAIEVAKAGSSVKVIEKMDVLGGNSAINGGAIVAAGSPLQAKEGIKDSADLLYKDMMKAGLYLNHPDLARIVADRNMETLNWTIDYLGVEYNPILTFFGGHSVKRSYGTKKGGGWGIVEKELAKAKELGVEVKTNRLLTKLIRDEKDGRVKGVEIRDGYTFPDETSGEVKYIKAKRAVVLASGGFGSDIRMRTIQDPRLTDELDCTNHPGATGEAMREAFGIGANVVHISWIQLGPWTSPDEKGFGFAPGFILVGAKNFGMQIDPDTGKRFMNEMGTRKECADAILKVGHPVISITDSVGVAVPLKVLRTWMEKALEAGTVRKFDTVEELISFYKINEAFKEELNRYNSFVEKGVDEDFGRPILEGAKPLTEPPFYACRAFPKVHHCMGGTQVNTKTEVIDLEGEVIKGLYAAGEVAGGIHGACRLGSVATSDCITNGRIAGKNAAGEEPWEQMYSLDYNRLFEKTAIGV